MPAGVVYLRRGCGELTSSCCPELPLNAQLFSYLATTAISVATCLLVLLLVLEDAHGQLLSDVLRKRNNAARVVSLLFL